MIYDILYYTFWASLGIQLIYWLFIFSRLAFYKAKKQKQLGAATYEPVSIVIAARNEEKNLAPLLEALQKQDYPQYEIVLVNDRSYDGTYDFLREIKPTIPNLKVVTVENCPEHINGKKYALTLGIKAASHDLILLTDADCLPASDQWIKGMASAFLPKTQLVLGYSTYKKEKGFLNYFIRFETLYTGIQYLSMCLAGKPYMGVGRNMAYRKALFIQNKGFIKHQRITGGDDDLFVNQHANAQITEIAVGEEKNTVSVPEKTFKAYFRQKKRHLAVGKKYKFSDKLLLGILSLSHILVWASFLSLLFLVKEPYWIAGGFLIRILSQYFVFIASAKKLGDPINLWGLPLLDFLYVLYYLFTGMTVFFSKEVKWK